VEEFKPPEIDAAVSSRRRHLEKLVCQCGGEIKRPIPKKCPHCGAQITGVKQRLWPLILPVLAILLMIAALIGFVWFWVNYLQ